MYSRPMAARTAPRTAPDFRTAPRAPRTPRGRTEVSRHYVGLTYALQVIEADGRVSVTTGSLSEADVRRDAALCRKVFAQHAADKSIRVVAVHTWAIVVLDDPALDPAHLVEDGDGEHTVYVESQIATDL